MWRGSDTRPRYDGITGARTPNDVDYTPWEGHAKNFMVVGGRSQDFARPNPAEGKTRTVEQSCNDIVPISSNVSIQHNAGDKAQVQTTREARVRSSIETSHSNETPIIRISSTTPSRSATSTPYYLSLTRTSVFQLRRRRSRQSSPPEPSDPMVASLPHPHSSLSPLRPSSLAKAPVPASTKSVVQTFY